MRRPVLIGLFSTLWLACVASLPRPTDEHAAAAARRWPGTTRVDLERGRQVYVDHCSACHALFTPDRFPAAKWERMAGEMSRRARVKPGDREVLVRYLVALSRSGTY